MRQGIRTGENSKSGRISDWPCNTKESLESCKCRKATESIQRALHRVTPRDTAPRRRAARPIHRPVDIRPLTAKLQLICLGFAHRESYDHKSVLRYLSPES